MIAVTESAPAQTSAQDAANAEEAASVVSSYSSKGPCSWGFCTIGGAASAGDDGIADPAEEEMSASGYGAVDDWLDAGAGVWTWLFSEQESREGLKVIKIAAESDDADASRSPGWAPFAACKDCSCCHRSTVDGCSPQAMSDIDTTASANDSWSEREASRAESEDAASNTSARSELEGAVPQEGAGIAVSGRVLSRIRLSL